MIMVDILHGPQCDSNLWDAVLEHIYEVGLAQCIEAYDFIVLIIYQPTEVLSTARQIELPSLLYISLPLVVVMASVESTFPTG
jgi:hypothetical protein